MQLRYKFYFGGNYNPYEKEAEEAYAQLTKEREAADPQKNTPLERIFPMLDGWADYLISNSKSVFWQMEKAISHDEENKASEIEELWEEGNRNGEVGEWLKKAKAEESTKALCYYMASLHNMFDPIGNAVDFRYYITEGRKPMHSNDGEWNSQEIYE